MLTASRSQPQGTALPILVPKEKTPGSGPVGGGGKGVWTFSQHLLLTGPCLVCVTSLILGPVKWP